MKVLRNVMARMALKLDKIVSKPAPGPAGGFLNDLGREAFGALDENGDLYVIGYKGEWFHKTKPSIRVRFHDWLVNVVEPHRETPNDSGLG
jgi:hypothetical protein